MGEHNYQYKGRKEEREEGKNREHQRETGNTIPKGKKKKEKNKEELNRSAYGNASGG